MKISKNTKLKEKQLLGIFFLVVILLNIISMIYVHAFSIDPPNYDRKGAKFGEIPIQYNSNTESLGYIDNQNISLHWFIHVTDIHLTHDNNSERNQAYSRFINYSYYNIHPFTVIVTGDLIGGQRHGFYDNISGNPETQYMNYFSIVNSSPYRTDPNLYRYLDSPGNHDRNADWGARSFLNYTLTGSRLGTTQALFSANFSSGTTTYSVLDSAPYNAPPVLFGSEGHLDSIDLSEYELFLKKTETAETKFSFHHHHPLITFGAYNSPTSNILQSEMSLNSKYGVDAVFYGHTHMEFMETYGDCVWIMGDRWGDQYVDTDTGETLTNSYHLVSIDNNGVNYQEVYFSSLPNIIVTNPSNPYFLDSNDKISNTRGDGHIRTLVFGNESDPIKSVDYQLDSGNWIPMSLTQNSEVLYESSRGSSISPLYAIPNDGKAHTVKIRVKLASGEIHYQEAQVSYNAARKMFFEGILIGLLIGLIGIVFVINRDNYPLKRADGKRRRLTREEKVEKRKEWNQSHNKPWWLPFAGFSIFISFILIPWGVFPLIQSSPTLVYSSFLYNPAIGSFFVIESLIYVSIIFVFGLLSLYWGIRTYHPEVVNFGSFLIIINTIFVIGIAFESYNAAGLFLPGIYVQLGLAICIFLGNFKNTFATRLIKKFIKKS
jgi:calcineurin-like phosphoesterase family protein